MNYFKLSVILLIVPLTVGAEDDVKFYRSEEDFLRGVEISLDRVGRGAYLEVLYDESGNVLRKRFYRTVGHLIEFEILSYDAETGSLLEKSVFDSDSTLVRRTVFGPGERMSERYIRYLYGVEGLGDFHDRFTAIEFADGHRPIIYRFFDVNAFLYGVINLTYDSGERLRQEDWVSTTEERVVRRYLYSYDLENDTTEIWEYDSTSALVMNMKVGPDGMAPLVSVIFPIDSSSTNSPNISYSLANHLEEGEIVWEWVSGKPDPAAPHQAKLTDEERRRGVHESADLRHSPVLVDSAVYDVRFMGTGELGYPAKKTQIDYVTYDTTPPRYTVHAEPYVNRPTISLTLEEELSSAEAIWTWERGERDPRGPHTIGLSRGFLGQGKHRSVSLEDGIKLNDGTVYTVVFAGKDEAGNLGPVVKVPGISYDSVPPRLSLMKPASRSRIASSGVSYSLSEVLSEGEMVWRQVSGVVDTQSPHRVSLTATEMKPGKHQYVMLQNAPQLVDGAVYEIAVQAVDRAGNRSDSLFATNVTADFTPPVLTVHRPRDGEPARNSTISYSLSEDFSAGRIEWYKIREDTAVSAPRIVPIDSLHLGSGDHTLVDTDSAVAAEDGVLYRVLLTGRDLAGNEAVPVEVGSILVDATSPVFAHLYPPDSSHVNSDTLSYTLSEDLSRGEVTWTQVAGEYDAGSPHTAALDPSERNSGEHSKVVLSDSPLLIDGSVYNITFTGEDAAGNRSEKTVLHRIVFDITPPETRFAYPQSRSAVPTSEITYFLSELLSEAEITWERVGGTEDDQSPHIVTLGDEELEPGSHRRAFAPDSLPLVNGAVYDVTIQGRDLSGLSSAPDEVVAMRFDPTPPEIAVSYPAEDSKINSPTVHYGISEPLSSGTIVWTRIGGEEDTLSPHTVFLTPTELAAGDHVEPSQVNVPPLKSGSFYRLTMFGEDSAGNSSDTIGIAQILFDRIPPTLQVEYPVASVPTNSVGVAYTVSEPLREGSVSWLWSGGTVDRDSVHIQEFTGKELDAGDHSRSILSSEPPPVVEGGIYTIVFNGVDLAGNDAAPVQIPDVLYDPTRPAFAGIRPSNHDHVNSSQISYSLSESLESGNVTWTWTGGKKDTESPYVVDLAGSQLDAGPHEDVLLAPEPALKDSAIYIVRFEGRDAAGNISDTVEVSNILYDVTPPRIELAYPQSGSFVAKPEISYVLSENLSEGTVTWERTSGQIDPDSVHVGSLAGDALLSGSHTEIRLEEIPGLEQGSIYSVTLVGADRAGNRSEPVVISQVGFDSSVPEFSDIFPERGSWVNHTQVAYTLSETVLSGVVRWIRTGGAPDPGSPHTVTLQSGELVVGPHALGDLSESPSLVDSALYSLEFLARDSAGNASDTARVDSVGYDVTPPTIAVAIPLPQTSISSAEVHYSLSESLLEGRLVWTRTGGSADDTAPHEIALVGENLMKGERSVVPVDPSVLQDGSTYSLSVDGTDRAGNKSLPAIFEEITFDGTAPIISDVLPSDSSFVNHERISYTLSEPLRKAEVSWVRIGGNEDPNSPHRVELTDEEMTAGTHGDAPLGNQSPLQDGSVYGVHFSGIDAAGNVADSVTVSHVTYDVSPPVIELNYPENGSHISSSRIRYNLSEDLAEGSLSWTRTGGTPDEAGPRSVLLLDSLLLSGSHEEEFVLEPSLINGAAYSVTMDGTDLAGNAADPTVVSQVVFDSDPPVIAVTAPLPNQHVNTAAVTYEVNEDMKGATVVWERTDGASDPSSPHEVVLVLDELTAGEHLDVVFTNSPQLMDGAVYRMKFVGVDYGDNVSDTVEVGGIDFDVTPPVISLIYPEPHSFVNTKKASFSLSEPLSEGTISWQWISGNTDGKSVHSIPLSDASLDSGDHLDWEASPPPELVDGATYRLSVTGSDSAGNASQEAAVERVTFDITPPVISLESPSDSSYRNHSRISYSISETLKNGKGFWRRRGGKEDNNSPHEFDLSGQQLTAGSHPEILPEQPVVLTDSTTYALELTGIDLAGNESDTVVIENVAYDISPPTYQIVIPEERSFVNSPLTKYVIDENLRSATINWDRTAGAGDPNSPHVVDLPVEGLTMGEDSAAQEVSLMDNALYTVTLTGTDLAGNDGSPVAVTGVTFDNTSPVVTLTVPGVGAFVNRSVISYVLSEDLDSAHISWSAAGGVPDPGAPHARILGEDDLVMGDHPEVELLPGPVLVDGALYDVEFLGFDLAGNSSQEVVAGVTYDTTAPAISLLYPPADTSVNSPVISYELSEDLESGAVTWQGPESSSFRSELTGGELNRGVHENILLGQLPELADGTIYTVTIEGSDLAGNTADSVSAENVTFDVSPPVIVANYPAPSSTVNTSRVSYSLSEELVEGSVTWTRTGGSEDTGSPHVRSFVAPELNTGDHQDVLFDPPPALVDNAVYSVRFEGYDFAGNRSSGMTVESVTFDSLKPVLALKMPVPEGHINEPTVSYELSEELRDGFLTWTRESGSEDPASPHRVQLLEGELRAGDHDSVVTTISPTLQNGTIYTVSLSGSDAAGNQGDSVTVFGVVFDSEHPTLLIEAPLSNSFTNSPRITYSLSEEMGWATVTWTATGGKPDPASPHPVELVAEELGEGVHEDAVLVNQTGLTGGSVYDLHLSGRDLAGNEAQSPITEGIRFDTSPPLFTQILPTSESHINQLVISYTLSETLSTGRLTISRIGGVADPGSPYVFDLEGENLLEGRGEYLVTEELATGASYSVLAAGSDRAGNSIDTVAIDQLFFDSVPPQFSVISPSDSAYVNHARISYELSEQLSEGSVTWVAADGSGPVQQFLVESEMTEGIHDDIILANPPDLVDGKVYDVRFEGKDVADNTSDPVISEGVRFDITVPKIRITLDSEVPRTFTSETPVTVRNSERMSEITFTWQRESGAEDSESPHVLALPEENLLQGDHEGILIPGSDALIPGTVYTLRVQGSDLAGNESTPLTVEGIDMIRDLAGEWHSKTALLTAVWSFSEERDFLQGVIMGTRISQKEPGTYSIDFSKRPFEMTFEFESGVRRYAIFEFTGRNSLRVAIGETMPSSWSEGDLMEFETSEPQVP